MSLMRSCEYRKTIRLLSKRDTGGVKQLDLLLLLLCVLGRILVVCLHSRSLGAAAAFLSFVCIPDLWEQLQQSLACRSSAPAEVDKPLDSTLQTDRLQTLKLFLRCYHSVPLCLDNFLAIVCVLDIMAELPQPHMQGAHPLL
jgi:hypothetical protein